MKKKILSLILVLMFLPLASIFAGCKDKSYNLDNLSNDFNAIQTENANIQVKNGKFVFDYSMHPNLESVIDAHYPYSEIEYYNFVYENLMAFSFEYIDECSNNNITKDKNLKNALKSDLDNLKKSISDVNSSVNVLAEIVNVSYNDDIFTTACMSGLENLFISYEDLYKSASDFHNTLSNLYFNNAIRNANPNIVEIAIGDFDAAVVTNNLDARLKWQISNLSVCFVEMYIDGGNIAKNIIEEDGYFDADTFNYAENVTKISKVFNSQVAAEKANNAINKNKYYALAIQAYNIQSAINNDTAKFVHACNDVRYAGLNLGEANSNEKMCAGIIDSRNELLSNYNTVLIEMLKITNG